MNALNTVRPDVDVSESSSIASTAAPEREAESGIGLVLPREGATSQLPSDAKTVRELQEMIERAFALLDQAADAGGDPAGVPQAPAPPEKVHTMGPAAGSELRYRQSLASRIFKTFAGTAIAVAVGLVPLQRVTTPVSNEAFVDAPVYDLRAPIDGTIATGQLVVGALVERGVPLALVASAQSSAGDTAVVSDGGGKVWQVLFQSGDRVAKGDLVARVVGCSASRVTATVSEAVYDKLRPGMSARFNFLGSNRVYTGTVAVLLGHAAAAGSAVSSTALAADGFRAVVSVPDLGAIENCAVGRRGIVIFGRQVL